jgi:hypothetical protein
MKITALLITAICLHYAAQAQNLTGIWVGNAGMSAPYVKLELVHVNDSLFGTAYDEGGGFCKTNFAASFTVANQHFKGKALSFIDRTSNHVLTEYSLYYEKRGDAEYLIGTSRPRSTFAKILSFGMGSPTTLRKESSRPNNITIFMRENMARLATVKPPPADTVAAVKIIPVPPKDTVVVKTPVKEPVVLAVADSIKQIKEKRSSPVIKTIETEADSVQLFLYDEGVVDGDIVTVFVNNAVVLSRFSLTDRPGELKVPVNKTQPTEIVLVAHNLGSIPPNTALVIIKAGTERYEIRAEFDLNANAKIVIKHRQ